MKEIEVNKVMIVQKSVVRNHFTKYEVVLIMGAFRQIEEIF